MCRTERYYFSLGRGHIRCSSGFRFRATFIFSLYNDIPAGISSRLRLFADDCVVYRKITSERDSIDLQTDLTKIVSWCEKWKMQLNAKKCVHVPFTKKKKKIETCYFLNSDIINQQFIYKYLGVTFSSDCSWNAHVNNVVTKAARALNFIQRNLKSSPFILKNTAYISFVRPILEYACCVWDPRQKTLIDKIERLQNRAARFVLGRYRRGESCTQMKSELEWEALSSRRRKLRLKLLFQIYNNKTGINRDTYLKPPHYISKRTDHDLKIREYRTRTNLYANSFFARTVTEWNQLSCDQVCCVNEDLFFSKL